VKVFITGGTSGIGLALAIKYLDQGYKVGVCGRDLSKVPTAVIEKYNNNLSLFQVDVTSREELKSSIAKFAEGRLDILIASAGISIPHKKTLPDFDRAHAIINTNVLGLLNSFEAALEVMLPNKGGKLVAIASVAGMIGVPRAAAYCASKAAVIKFCESLTVDLLPKGINVITIAPGFIDTPLTQQNNHPLPFVIDSSTAAEKIYVAIENNIPLYIFPIPMKILIYFLYFLPRWLYRRFMMFIQWGGES